MRGRKRRLRDDGLRASGAPFWGGRLLDYQGADIYVDKRGQRFVNENSPWNVISNAILSLPEKRCWVITDDRSFKGRQLGVKLINGVVKKSHSIDRNGGRHEHRARRSQQHDRGIQPRG